MNIKQLVDQAKVNAPLQLGLVPDIKAKKLLQEAFAVILHELDEIDEGLVKVGGLGSFQIKKLVVVKNGQEQTVRRLMFRPISCKT